MLPLRRVGTSVMGRWLATQWLAKCARLGAFAALLHAPAALAESPCGAAGLDEGRVVAIPDSHTITLDDGRLIKLAGIVWMVPADLARGTLSSALLGRTVSLKGS